MVSHLHGAAQSEAAAIESGSLPRKVAVSELREAHPHVAPDASCEVLEGWRGILDASLGSMADLKVRVTDIRVKVGALTMAVLPSDGTWRGGDAALVASCLRQAV